MASPLTVSGVTGSVAQALSAASAKAGRPVLAVPPGPLGSFPAQTLRPGSAVAAGYSNGDIRTSAVGTVAYVDGDRVWVFGHSLEAAGRRALLLQDAYVFRIVNNPNQLGAIGATYKLAASGHDLGTVTSDGFSAVAGRTGRVPAHGPGPGDRAGHRQQGDEDDPDRGGRRGGRGPPERRLVDVVRGAAGGRAGRRRGARQHARAPDRHDVRPDHDRGDREAAAVLQPLRLDRRRPGRRRQHVQRGPVRRRHRPRRRAGHDRRLHRERRRASPASTCCCGSTAAPTRRSSAASGSRPAPGAASACAPACRLQLVRGGRLTRTYTVRIPDDARPGTRRVRFVGQDADQGEDGFTTIILGEEDERDEGGDPGPATLARTRRAGPRDAALRRRQHPHRRRPRQRVPRRRLPDLRPARPRSGSFASRSGRRRPAAPAGRRPRAAARRAAPRRTRRSTRPSSRSASRPGSLRRARRSRSR